MLKALVASDPISLIHYRCSHLPPTYPPDSCIPRHSHVEMEITPIVSYGLGSTTDLGAILRPTLRVLLCMALGRRTLGFPLLPSVYKFCDSSSSSIDGFIHSLICSFVEQADME